jgi:hypothetical protein
VYFLMARIDVAGGSQGWFRAQLISAAIEHLDEWWFAGTDYTRHWMATGIHANDIHTDIVNQVLAMGVMGGLPLMALFIMVMVAAFRDVGRATRENEGASLDDRFLAWTLGALLFGHVMNFWSIYLFDQSVVFLYLVLAGIGAVQARKLSLARMADMPADELAIAQAGGRAAAPTGMGPPGGAVPMKEGLAPLGRPMAWWSAERSP